VTDHLDGAALITGATAGLGAVFARRLAAEGRDLVLVARDLERLQASAADLRERYPVAVDILSADLATDAGRRAVADRLADDTSPIDTLVNNAGFGLYASFGSVPLADEERLLDVNVRAVLVLTHAAVTAMTHRGRGEIINVASVAGFLPRGRAATYAAGKAWVISFSEGLSLRLAGTGVRICAICPGFVHTEFHQRANADMSDTPAWMWLDPDLVVADGLADARAGKPVSIPSRRYRAVLGLVRVLPRGLVRRAMARR